jgi:hypothetical protein
VISFARIVCCALTALVVTPPIAQGYTQLAGNDGGDQVLIEQVLGQETRSLLASVRAPGGAFAPLQPISAPYHFLGQVAGVDDAGGAAVLWRRERGAGTEAGDVLVASRAPGGRFRRARQLSHGGRAQGAGLTVNGRGDAIAFWALSRGASRFSFRPAGGSFGRPQALPGKGGTVAIVLDEDGGLFAVWSKPDAATKTQPVHSAYRPPGGAFGEPADVAGPPPERGLSDATIVANRAGNTLIAWKEGRAIKAIERAARGTSFSAPVTIADRLTKYQRIYALELGSGGTALLAIGPSPLTIRVRTGGAWSGPETFTAAKTLDGVNFSIDSRGDVAAVWADIDRSVKAVYRPPGGSFGPALQLGAPRPLAPGGDFVRPDVAIGGGGRATASWEQSNGAFVTVEARDFDGSGVKRRVRVGRLPSFRREGPPTACRPPWARVVRHSRRSTLLVARHGAYRGLHFACLLERGAVVELNEYEGFYPPVRLAGQLVGYATDACDPDYCNTVVEVTDLRDEEYGANRETNAGPMADSEVAAMRLRPNGSVAWVSCSSPFPAYGHVNRCTGATRVKKRIFAWDTRSERPRLADVSRRIDPASLALHGSRLTWRHGGKTRSTRLR